VSEEQAKFRNEVMAFRRQLLRELMEVPAGLPRELSHLNDRIELLNKLDRDGGMSLLTASYQETAETAS
jgi:hypothetical protein